MSRSILTDEEVEREIARLTTSEAVRLARQEQRIKYQRRQYMYGLRSLEKRGLQLMSEGLSLDKLDFYENEEGDL